MNFTKKTIITFITRFLKLVFGLGTMIIIARVLGAGGKGVYSLMLLLPGILIVFTEFGIGSSSVYLIGKKRYSAKEILGNSIVLSIITSILSLILGGIIIFTASDILFQGISKRYLLLGLTLIPFQFFTALITNILLGLRKIEKYNLIYFLPTFLFFLFLLFLLICPQYGLTAVIGSQIIGLLVSSIVLFAWTLKLTGGIAFSFNRKYLKEVFDYGFKTYLGGVFAFLFFRVDIFLINFFINPLAVGLYSIAVNFSENIWLISKSASTILFPEIANKEEKSRWLTPIVCRNVLLVTAVISLILLLFSKWLVVLLFGTRFLDSVLPLQILLIGTIAMSASRTITYDLYGRGRPLFSAYSNFIVIILNIVLNIFWIPKHGIIGAAWATSICYTLSFLMKLVFYAKISGNKIRDIILPQRSDLKLYLNIFKWLKKS